jgi:hypothetical protein
VPFEANRFRELATFLLGQTSFDDREALNRTVVGRLYYATYLRLRQYLRSHGTRVATVATVVRALTASPEFLGVGLDLETLHALRNEADYNDSIEFNSSKLELALVLTGRIEGEMAPHW